MQFGMGSQSREIRDNLSNFSKFLEHFSQAKWLGDLIAPEFEEQKKLAVKILKDLQTETRLALPACGQPAMCGHCRKMTLKTKGFCDSCQVCMCGYQASFYPNGCPGGCASLQQPQQQAPGYCSQCGHHNAQVPGQFCTNCTMCSHGYLASATCQYGCCSARVISIQPKNASSVYEGLASGCSSLDKLEGLVKMSEALLDAFRQDVAARKTAEKARVLALNCESVLGKEVDCATKKNDGCEIHEMLWVRQELEKKMALLKDFAESVNEVPQVWRVGAWWCLFSCPRIAFLALVFFPCVVRHSHLSGPPAVPADPCWVNQWHLWVESLGVGSQVSFSDHRMSWPLKHK